MRDLARKRCPSVRNRTLHILAVEGSVARQTGGQTSSNAVKQLSVKEIAQLRRVLAGRTVGPTSKLIPRWLRLTLDKFKHPSHS